MAPVLLALASCGPLEPSSASPESATPTPWSYTADTAPGLTAAEVEAALQPIVDEARSFHATPITAAYMRSMTARTPTCPTVYATGGIPYWYDQCRTEEGVAYNGYLFALERPDAAEVVYDGMSLWGSATVTQADGRVFQFGGRAEATRAVTAGAQTYVSRAYGTFAWSGEEADGTWLADGLSLDLEMVAFTLEDDTNRVALTLHGGVAGFTGALPAVRFEGIAATSALADACLPEPSGVIAVRDERGRWYTVTFDGPTAEDASACDGCGAFEGQGEGGTVCLDTTALTDWGDTPPW